jgi:hypothetical protein
VRIAQGDEIIGEQAQPCIAHIGLDDYRATGHLCLTPEGLELSA